MRSTLAGLGSLLWEVSRGMLGLRRAPDELAWNLTESDCAWGVRVTERRRLDGVGLIAGSRNPIGTELLMLYAAERTGRRLDGPAGGAGLHAIFLPGYYDVTRALEAAGDCTQGTLTETTLEDGSRWQELLVDGLHVRQAGN